MSVDKEEDLQNRQPANGVVTVNDEKNPTREERDQRIPAEPDTERLRSERQSVQEGQSRTAGEGSVD